MRHFVRLGLLLAFAAFLALILVPVGWRAGLWHYSISLQMMRWVAYLAIAGAAASLLGLLGWRRLSRSLRLGAIAALLVSALLFAMPMRYSLAAISIHDISTDTDNPPLFIAVMPARQAANAASATYAGANLAATQHAAYPDIAPLLLKLAPDEAFRRALAAAQAMPRWTIVAEDPQSGRIEATARTFWMGFADDVVIRITADGADSRVDMRSLSRVGRGDFGANAGRIRAYFAVLRAAD